MGELDNFSILKFFFFLTTTGETECEFFSSYLSFSKKILHNEIGKLQEAQHSSESQYSPRGQYILQNETWIVPLGEQLEHWDFNKVESETNTVLDFIMHLPSQKQLLFMFDVVSVDNTLVMWKTTERFLSFSFFLTAPLCKTRFLHTT